MLVYLAMTPTVARNPTVSAVDSIFLSRSLAELVNREARPQTDPVMAI